MADDLKRLYNRELIEGLAFDLDLPSGFIDECLSGLEALELMARAAHIAEVMHRHLPTYFPDTAAVLIRSLQAPTAGNSFRFLPHSLLISRYGIDHFEEAMQAQYELTKRFTAEFSIRAFFEKYPAETHARFTEWARDENHHVRRLVSEGSRPRLPWAARLRAFQQDPAPVIALLELLKDDPELYVRRSVANNLNDIAKDHPQKAVEVCRRWGKDAGPERWWIIRQALRSLVKQGHPEALEILGFAGSPKVQISNVAFAPPTLRIGDTLRFSFDLTSTSARKQTLLVDYAIHYVKANGRPARKVFKLTSAILPPRGSVTLRATTSFREMTTRKHYPGIHALDVLINGVIFPLGAVTLTA